MMTRTHYPVVLALQDFVKLDDSIAAESILSYRHDAILVALAHCVKNDEWITRADLNSCETTIDLTAFNFRLISFMYSDTNAVNVLYL